jgi:hypothetical protein
LSEFSLNLTEVIVSQEPSLRDHTPDFAFEIPIYLDCSRIVEVVSEAISANDSLQSNLYKAHMGLFRAGTVCEKKIAWREAHVNVIQRTRKTSA